VLLALLGATAGQGVVYTGQFYALFFLLIAYSNAKRPLIPTDGGQDSN
jgi:hypothetical protein